MARRVVLGELRVQQIQCSDGRRSWTIVWPEETEHPEADRFLRKHEGSGTQRTYAYVLVDHLRWLERECLTLHGSVAGSGTLHGHSRCRGADAVGRAVAGR